MLRRLIIKSVVHEKHENSYAGSQAPAWEPSEQSSSFASREARASRTEFPSRSLGTSATYGSLFFVLFVDNA